MKKILRKLNQLRLRLEWELWLLIIQAGVHDAVANVAMDPLANDMALNCLLLELAQ